VYSYALSCIRCRFSETTLKTKIVIILYTLYTVLLK